MSDGHNRSKRAVLTCGRDDLNTPDPIRPRSTIPSTVLAGLLRVFLSKSAACMFWMADWYDWTVATAVVRLLCRIRSTEPSDTSRLACSFRELWTAPARRAG